MNIIVALLILSVIVIVHELGHFLLAKKNGITVTEFSIGMGPRIASFVKKGTRYSLKLFPIGGSCMMLGEDDTIEDEGAFNKKSAGARFSVLFAGAFFNFILAFVLALIVLGVGGVDLPKILEVKAGSPAQNAGIKAGDRITEINGANIHLGRDMYYYFYFKPLTKNKINVSYIRDGKKYKTAISPRYYPTYTLGCKFDPQKDNAEILSLEKGYPLKKAGVLPGDIIVRINDTEIKTGKDMSDYIAKYPFTKKKVTITYKRAVQGSEAKETTLTIMPKLASSRYEAGWSYNLGREKVSSFSVIKYSFYELKLNIVTAVKSVEFLITGKIKFNNLSGPVGIVNMVGNVVSETKADGIGITLLSLLNFCILLSANLGVMNLLPLPALDGGRLVFILIEAVRGKPVPKEKEAIVHMVGMAALMVLMVFVMYNDIRNIFR